MPLISLWKSNPSAIDEFSIEQVVTSAGDGKLKDGSSCASELREFLSEVSSSKLSSYISDCLTGPFTKSGLVLQDLVNELGRRLDCKVLNGRYSGVKGEIGFDGLWLAPENHSVVVEVKTTDAYRMSLDTVVKYRESLIRQNEIGTNSSILLVVGREDTGELEAQIRGSRHAWDIRLISIEALLQLVKLKEKIEGKEIDEKIRRVLFPIEYTKLDGLIEAMFSTAANIASVTEEEITQREFENGSTDDKESKSQYEFTDSETLQNQRDKIISAIEREYSTKLVKKSRATYWDARRGFRVVCTISKRYKNRNTPYWYAYHPQWNDFLLEGSNGLFILGCMDTKYAYALPISEIEKHLKDFNETIREESGNKYWHIKLVESQPGELTLQLPKVGSNKSLAEYKIEI